MNQLEDYLKEVTEKSKNDRWLVLSYVSGTVCLRHQCVNLTININCYDDTCEQEDRHMTAYKLCSFLNGGIDEPDFTIVEVNPGQTQNLGVFSNGTSFSISGPYFEEEKGSGMWKTDFSRTSCFLRTCLFNYILRLFKIL